METNEIEEINLTNDDLNLTIGNEEITTLKPTLVKIVRLEIGEFGPKKSKKVICYCKHPDKDDLIQISEAAFIVKGKLETSGLWINKDSKGLIRKGSGLAILLESMGCKIISSLVGKEVITTIDNNGYLCFKAY